MNERVNRYQFYVVATLLAFASLSFDAIAQTAPETRMFTYNGNPVSIPQESAELAATAEIFVPAALRIDDVRLQAHHPLFMIQ